MVVFTDSRRIKMEGVESKPAGSEELAARAGMAPFRSVGWRSWVGDVPKICPLVNVDPSLGLNMSVLKCALGEPKVPERMYIAG